MKFCRQFLLVLFATAASALFAPTPAHAAAIVAITHEKFDHCGRGFVFCNARQAYSLTEIENGTVQLPIFPILPSEFVIVNDTGHTVTSMEFTLTTLELFSFKMQCLIESSAKQYFDSCKVATQNSGFSRNLFSTLTAQFTFTAKNSEGIPDGDYFDVKTIGFLPGGYLSGGGESGGGGTGGTGGGGGGGGGNDGPPQQ
jgi:hypothetical protein